MARRTIIFKSRNYGYEAQYISYVQWVLDYPNPNYPYPNTRTLADIAMFLAAAGKRRCGFATGESKAAV